MVEPVRTPAQQRRIDDGDQILRAAQVAQRYGRPWWVRFTVRLMVAVARAIKAGEV